MANKKTAEKIKQLWKWLRQNVINREMLWAFLIAEIIFWSPCAVFAILATTVNPWFWTVFTAIVIFWSAPLTPGWALQIALALFVKKRIDILKTKYVRVDKLQKLKNKNKNKTTNENTNTIENQFEIK